MGMFTGATPTLFMSVIVATFGSSMIFGYNMGVTANIQWGIQCFLKPWSCFINTTYMDPAAKGARGEFESLSGIYIVLGALSAFLSGYLSNFFGRKKSLFFNSFVAIVAAGLMLLTLGTRSVVCLYIARLVYGINSGITSVIVPLFLSEIAPTPIRGFIMVFHPLFITFGVVLAYIVTLKQFLNFANNWLYAMAIPFIPALLSLILLPMCPESPRFTLVNLKEEENAKIIFQKYNSASDASAQIDEVKKEVDASNLSPTYSIFALLLNKPLRLTLVLGIVINLMQQFSGITAIISYAILKFKDSRISERDIEFCTLSLGILNFLVTIPALILLDLIGRRPIILITTIIAEASMFILFIILGIVPFITNTDNAFKNSAIVSGIFFCLFIIAFGLGMATVPAIVTSEIFTQTPRAAGMSIAMGIQWIAALPIIFLYSLINSNIFPGFIFLFFMVISGACFAVVIIFMPETKKRTFLDIHSDMSGNRVANNSQA